MKHPLEFRNRRARLLCRPSTRWSRVGVVMMLSISAALASVPTSNELGIRFKVLRTAPTAMVEIRIAPRRAFDSVVVEPAGGVASITPSCAFSAGQVAAGKSYLCRVELEGKPSEAAMTINVVARRSSSDGGVPVMEVHHLTVRNTAVAMSEKKPTASHHDVADTAVPPR